MLSIESPHVIPGVPAVGGYIYPTDSFAFLTRLFLLDHFSSPYPGSIAIFLTVLSIGKAIFCIIPAIMDRAREQARKEGGGFELVDDMEAAFKGADIIYEKSWGPLLTTTDSEEGKRIQDQYKDWITDERKMALAGEDSIYMHPLQTFHRGSFFNTTKLNEIIFVRSAGNMIQN